MNDDRNALFAANLRRVRQQRGMTQTALAKAIEKTHATISYIERGRSFTTIATLLDIAEALGVEPAELLREPERCESCGQYLPAGRGDSVRAVGDE